jgi:hypothetical protein
MAGDLTTAAGIYAAAVVLIGGVVQLVKSGGLVEPKYCPLLALLLGLLIGVGVFLTFREDPNSMPLMAHVLSGIMAGLSASGGYDLLTRSLPAAAREASGGQRRP